MPEVRSDLVLNMDDAISAIDNLSTQLDSVASNFGETLSQSMAGASGGTGTLQEGVDTSNIEQEVAQAIDTGAQEADLAGHLDATAMGTELTDSVDTALADTHAEVPVEADTAPAEDAITSLDSEADSTPVDIPVEADTSGAQDQVDQLTQSSDNAGSSMGALGSKMQSGSGIANAAATGGFLSLANQMGNLGGPEAGAVVGGMTAAAGTILDFGQKALTAQGSVDAARQIIGKFWNQVQQIHVGDFTGSLNDLGMKFGSTSAQMATSAGKAFEWAQGANMGGQASAAFTGQVAALAGRVVSLHPQMGSLSDVADRLERSLAMGGPRLQQMGISLDKTDISMRAVVIGAGGAAQAEQLMADAANKNAADHDQAAATLKRFESSIPLKAMAGAQLATEKYGSSLKEKLDQGAQNPINQQKSLTATMNELIETIAKPLIAPFLELIKAGLPIVKMMATMLTELGKDALPAVIQVMKDSAPALDTFAMLIKELNPVLQPLIQLMIYMANPIALITGAFQFLSGSLGDVGGALSSVGDFFSNLGSGIANFASSVGQDILKVVGFFLDLPAKIVGALGSLGGDILNLFTGALNSVLNFVVGWIGQQLNFWLNLPGQIISALGSLAGDLLNLGSDALNALFSGITGAAGQVFDFFTNLPGKIISAIGDIAGRFFQIGKDIVDGIINGIGDIGSAIADKITGGIGGIISDVSNFLGIGSPSRLFAEEIGLPIAQGIALGVTSGIPDINTAFGTLQTALGPSGLATTFGTTAMASPGIGGEALSVSLNPADISNLAQALTDAINNSEMSGVTVVQSTSAQQTLASVPAAARTLLAPYLVSGRS